MFNLAPAQVQPPVPRTTAHSLHSTLAEIQRTSSPQPLRIPPDCVQPKSRSSWARGQALHAPAAPLDVLQLQHMGLAPLSLITVAVRLVTDKTGPSGPTKKE